MEFARFSSYVSPLFKASLAKSALSATSIHCIDKTRRRNSTTSTTNSTSDATTSTPTSTSPPRLKRFNTRLKVDNLYEILGVNQTSSENEIRVAYKKLCLQFHPDHNPEGREQFESIHKAYQILRDPESRRQYDIQQLFCPSFTSFHYNAQQQQQQTQQQIHVHEDSSRDITHILPCTLEDLYLGKNKKFQIKRRAVCESCLNKHNDSELCRLCGGKYVHDEKKVFRVAIKRGMLNGQSIVFKGQGDEQYHMNRVKSQGNVVFTVKEKAHDTFTRRGDHLFIRYNLALTEALTGLFSFSINHLDGRHLHVISDHTICDEQDNVVKNGQVACIKNEGMPRMESSDKGNLYIQFNVAENQILKNRELVKRMKQTLPSRVTARPDSGSCVSLAKVNKDDILDILPESFI